MAVKIVIECAAVDSGSLQEKALREDEGQAINSGEAEPVKESRLALLSEGG
jgi:hypothetical protein